MFWGFGGQLQPHEYPNGWAALNQRLNQDRGKYQVLFLPWHLYMHYAFVGRIIASPAASYFDKPVVVSNELEFGGASPTVPDSRKTQLSKNILPNAAQGTHLGTQLAPLGIKYILLDKDDDYRSYSYLDHQADLHLISENTNFKLYLNTVFGGN